MLSLLTSLLVCCAGDLRVVAGDEPGRVQVVAPLPGGATWTEGVLARAQGEPYLQFALVDTATGQTSTPMLGEYRVLNSQLIWTPRFRLLAGATYRATLRHANAITATVDYHSPALIASEPPRIDAVFPTTDRVPANLLKFYIHFSQPMREGSDIFDQILLLDSAGRELNAPWRRTELWSSDARRLTLYIHPGRIKQGVNLREQEGPVLLPGQSYSLVITTTLRSAAGAPLATEHRKSFATLDEDRAPPNLLTWRVLSPTVATTEPLIVQTDKPFDRHLLARCLKVVDREGSMCRGTVAVVAGEQRWSFTPHVAWSPSEYQLVVDPILEDLAGNTPTRRFDHDLLNSDLLAGDPSASAAPANAAAARNPAPVTLERTFTPRRASLEATRSIGP